MKSLLCFLFLFFSVFTFSQETENDVKIAKYEKEFQALLFSYDFDNARKYYKSILNKGLSSKDKNLTVLGYKLYGNLLQHQKKIDSSILIKKKAIKINGERYNKLYGDLTFNLALSYSEKNEKDSTLTYLLKSEKAYKKIKNYRGLCYLNNFLSTNYLIDNELFKSKEAIENLFGYNEIYQDKFFEGVYYSRVGDIKTILGAYTQSRISINKSIEIFRENNNQYYYLMALSKLIATNILEEINWKESRKLMNESLILINKNKIADEPFILNIYFMNCTLLLYENEIKKAEIEISKLNKKVNNSDIPLLKELYKISRLELLLKQNKIREFKNLRAQVKLSNFTPDLRLQYLRISYEFYLDKNQTLAIENLENYWKIKDSTTNSILLKNIIYNQEKFETRKKEKENLELHAEKLEQELATTNANRQKWIFAGGLFCALLALGIFAFYYRKNKKQKEVIESLQKELHHRIKNNLSIIDTFIEVSKDDFEDPKFSKKLTELQNRIDSINEVHQQLYKNKDVTNLDIKKYIDTLSNNVTNSFSISNITIEKSITDNLNLHVDKSFPIGLIINEFLTNSYKYAFDNEIGKVKIEIKDLDGNYQLKLSDNGKGLPQNFDIKTTESFGLRIMKLLTEQLNGNFNLSNKDGVSLIINFPK